MAIIEMVYILLKGSHEQTIISIYTTLEDAKRGGDQLIDKYKCLLIEEWIPNLGDQYPHKVWQKLVDKNFPDYSFDWSMI